MSAAEIISLYAIAEIWFMMILNVILSIGGFIYIYRCNKSDGSIPMDEKDYPMVSILVPAHNEALVLKRTVQALLSFDYPKENTRSSSSTTTPATAPNRFSPILRPATRITG